MALTFGKLRNHLTKVVSNAPQKASDEVYSLRTGQHSDRLYEKWNAMATLFSIHFESYSFSRFRKSMKSGNHHSSLQLLICTALKAQNKPERSKKTTL